MQSVRAVAFAVALTGLIAAGGSRASELDSALGALERLDYAGAANILTVLAEAGDPRAQAALATLMESGRFATDYPETPLALLHKAAGQGVPEAALELGNRYYLGDGVTPDAAESMRWWRRAAEAGSNRAAYNLGVATLRGNGVQADPEAAESWFRLAAEDDIAAAWFAIGVLELRDAPDSVRYRSACSDFERAAAAGMAVAQYNLGIMYEHGIACPTDVTRAASWYSRAADAGFERAKSALQRLPDNAAGDTILDSDWVLRQDGSHYTLQVANGGDKSAIVAILGQFELSAARAFFRVPGTGDTRYLALIGSFSSYLDALNYLNNLPPALTGTKPWIRRFRSVQALMTQ